MIRKPLFIFGLLVISIILYMIIAQMGDFRHRIFDYLLISAFLFAIYVIFVFIALRYQNNLSVHWGWFLLVGLISRLILFPTTPTLSDDVYRYLWDGRVAASGINPYQLPPNSPELNSLQDIEIHPNINFPEIATVYPPVAQMFFLLNEWLGGTFLSWKIILLLVEIALVIILFKLLRHFSINPHRIIIFICNPLLIIETYHSGHLEIIGLMFFWLAVFAFYKKFDRLSIACIILSILVKFLPIVMAIPFLIKRFWRKIVIISFACILSLIPFCLNNSIPVAGSFSYMNRWSFNGAIFKALTSLINFFKLPAMEISTINLNGHLETFYVNSEFYYKIIALIIFLIIAIDQMRKLKATSDFRSINYLQAGFMITGSLLLLTPTLHPWYIVILIPYLIFLPNWAWLSFTFLIQLSYHVLKKYAALGTWEESNWILMAEYIPFYILLVMEYVDKRKIKGWFL